MEEPDFFMQWNTIPFMNYIRLLATMLLSTFFPGYAVFKLISGYGKTVGFLARVLISVHLSIFLSSLIALLGKLLERSITATAFDILISVNVLLFLFLLFAPKFGLSQSCNRGPRNFSIDFRLFIPIALILLFAIFAIVTTHFPDKFFQGYDQWVHYGATLRTIDGAPISLISIELDYPHSYLYSALSLVGAGFPFVNAYMFFTFLSILPILSFYLLINQFLSKTMSTAATMIYTLFSGFGGLYTIALILFERTDFNMAISLAQKRAFDITRGMNALDFLYQPQIIGLSCLFLLLYLIQKDVDLSPKNRLTIIFLVFVQGFLWHTVEMVMFMAFFIFITLFYKKYLFCSYKVSLATFMGLFFSLFFIWAFVPTLTLGSLFAFMNMRFLLILLLVLGSFMFSPILERLKLLQLFRTLAKKFVLSKFTLLLMLYFMGFCIIVWFYTLSALSIYSTGGSVPWYLYPIRLGFPLILGVLGIYILYKSQQIKGLIFGFILSIVPLGLARISNLLLTFNIVHLPFNEARISNFARIGFAILSSFLVVKMFSYSRTNRIHVLKRILVMFILALVFIGGFSSTLLSVQRFANTSFNTASDLELMQTIRSISTPNESVLAPELIIWGVKSFSGRGFVESNYHPILLVTEDLEHFLDLISENMYTSSGFDIRYLVLPKSDRAKSLTLPYSPISEVSYLLSIQDYLFKVFENEDFILYELPHFQSPSKNSDFVLMTVDAASSDLFKRGEFQIVDEAPISFWEETRRGDGDFDFNLTMDDSVANGGNSSLKVQIIPGHYSRISLIHWFSSPRDWSSYKSISFSCCGSGTKQLWSLILYMPDRLSQFHYTLVDDFIGWKEISINFNEFNVVGLPNLTTIEGIELRTFPAAASSLWLGSEISLANTTLNEFTFRAQILPLQTLSMANINYTTISFSDWYAFSKHYKKILLPLDPAEISNETLEWIANGGELIVLNTLELDRTLPGFFTKLLSINIEPTASEVDEIVGPGGKVDVTGLSVPFYETTDASVATLGFYTHRGETVSGFAFLKNFGQGKIILVEMNPIYYSLLNNHEDSTRQLFSSLADILMIVEPELPIATQSPSGPVGILNGPASFSNVEIIPTTFMFPDFCELEVSLYTPDNDDPAISEGTITYLDIDGNFTSIFSAPTAELVPSIGSYTEVNFIDGFNLTLKLTGETSLTLGLQQGSYVHNITQTGGDITFAVKITQTAESTVVQIKESFVQADSAYFANIFTEFTSPIYAIGGFMRVDDPLKFLLRSSDETTITISDLEINGTYTTQLVTSPVLVNEWAIPTEIFYSLPFILLNAVAIAMTYYLRRR
ncbi:MAG: hypothetical protein PVH73_05835 [Candidatus Bathyarchaeota archaeon]